MDDTPQFQQLRRLREEVQAELTGNILPYWSAKMPDNEHGGFLGRIDGLENPHPGAPKGSVLNGRILWTFSAAFRRLADPACKAIADRAQSYILRNFMDTEFGGVYWMLDAEGHPLETKKQVYAQAFVLYGLAEHYRATGEEQSLEAAIRLFGLLEQHSFDPLDDGYFEAYDRQWNLLDDLRLSDKDANEKKTMNTHLHVLEAYSNLMRVWPDERLRRQLRNLVQLFLRRFMSGQYYFHLFFDERWQLRSSTRSYGHDIEGSWLLHEAAGLSGDSALLNEVSVVAVKMATSVLQEGLAADGGLIYERREDGSTDTDRHWWPQAEAMVGFVNAWQISGDARFADAALRVWEYVREHLIDRQNGEWYWLVDSEGKPSVADDKAGPWKCPYHNGRACMELMDRLPV